MVHAAAGVTQCLVAQVECVMFWVECQVEYPNLEVLVSAPCTTLTAVGFEVLDFDTQRLAGVATVAVRAVSEHAAAAKALFHEVRIDLILNQVAGRGDLGSCRTMGQIAALVARRGIKLKSLYREILKMGHNVVSKAVNAVQYKVCLAQSTGCMSLAC